MSKPNPWPVGGPKFTLTEEERAVVRGQLLSKIAGTGDEALAKMVTQFIHPIYQLPQTASAVAAYAAFIADVTAYLTDQQERSQPKAEAP